MKISKKLLAAFSVAAMLVTALSVTGCKKEDDDDNAIDGNAINYTNSKDSIYRAYMSTNFKHLGELVKITFNNQTASSHDGVMGFIWDYKEAKSVDGSAAKTNGTSDTYNFFVIGFNGLGNPTTPGKPRFYISKYFNVPKGKLEEDNFGAGSNKVSTHADGIAKTDPYEIVVQDFTALDNVSIAADKTLTFWVDIYPVFNNSSYGVNIGNHRTDPEGTFVVDIYGEDPTTTATTRKLLKSVKIDTSVTGYTAKPEQAYLAKYANVQPGKTLSGNWRFLKDYAEDEVVEE